MAKITVYQKPTCTTCRQVYAALKESGVDFNAVDYYLEPIPKTKLRELLKKMGITASELIRKKEPIYKELKLDEKSSSLYALQANENGFDFVSGGKLYRYNVSNQELTIPYPSSTDKSVLSNTGMLASVFAGKNKIWSTSTGSISKDPISWISWLNTKNLEHKITE